MLDFVPTLLCRDVRVGVVYSLFEVVIPRWRSLCGRSLVDIVEILLCEGGDVEQWLEPRNISLRLYLIFYLSTLNSYILHRIITYIHKLDIVCIPTLVFNQDSY